MCTMLIHPALHLFLAAIQGDAQHFLRAFSGVVNGLLVFLRQAFPALFIDHQQIDVTVGIRGPLWLPARPEFRRRCPD